MPTPSLLIVPARWKTGSPGKLYSQIPTDGSGDFNVTGVITGGTNAGTRVNNLGYIEAVTTSGTPRLDYYTSGGVVGCPALLVEPSAQNLALRSEGFDVSGTWIPTSQGLGSVPIVTPNYTTSPDGLNNGFRLQSNLNGGTTTSDRSWLVQSISPAQTNTAQSVYAKLNSSGTAVFSVANNDTTLVTLTSTDWVRVATIRTGASANPSFRIGLIGVSGASNTIDISIWGAQLETGSVATSYIPTTTAAVTRNADVISVSGAVSGSIGQTEGTLYAEVDVRNLGLARSFINVQDSSYASNAVRVECNLSNQWRIQIRAATVGVLDQVISSPTISAGIYKIAFAYNTAASGVVFAVNGTIIYTNASALTMPSGMDRVNLGARVTSGFFDLFLNDRIRAAALYTTRLSNADLTLLTMPGNNTYLPQAVWDNYLSRPGNTEVPDCLYTRHADLLDV